ncbi:hypothetical protein VE03_03956 [Pseudogymnoascus sp. 23342-1-I1]|nr:hypothetical protein VE03_03956 [Pseudogymnoascus sp. 23342-1-I1]
MKFTNVVACSAALLSTSVLAGSTVYVTVVTCVSTDSAIPTATATDVVSPTGAAPTDVSPTDISPTDVSPTDVSPTDTAPTDVPVPSDTPDGTYPITGNTVNCRTGPGITYPVKKSYAKGNTVTITCQTPGTSINGNAIWDLTSDGCYLTDYYVKTGSSKYVKPQCDAASIPAPPATTEPTDPGTGSGDTGSAGEIKNDYPYGASTCGDVDRWYYYACQCTSFVAWRINERLDINFHNKYEGQPWGNADSWDDAARALGVKVDNTPVPGSIAQTDAGEAGHVAWVASVDGDSVTIEEYNYVKTEGYSTRTLPASTFKYIHLKY